MHFPPLRWGWENERKKEKGEERRRVIKIFSNTILFLDCPGDYQPCLEGVIESSLFNELDSASVVESSYLIVPLFSNDLLRLEY